MTRQVEATRRGPLFRPRDSPHAPGSQQGETQDNENVRDVRLSALGLDYQVMAKAAQYTSHGRIMRGATTPLGGLSTDGMFGLARSNDRAFSSTRLFGAR